MKRTGLSAKRNVAPLSGEPESAFWGEVLRTCGSFNLRKASRVVTQLYDDILSPTGLRSTQVVLLVALAAEGEMSMSRMAREVVMSPSTLSRTLRLLERDGLVERTSTDKRGKLMRLTAAGKQALSDAVPHWQKAQEKFVELVGLTAWSELNERLAKTVAATRR